MKKSISLIAMLFFLLSLPVFAAPSFAAEWELWPRGRGKATESGEPAPEAQAAGKAGEKAGKKSSEGLSAGTIGIIAAGAAGIIAIAVAAGGGGGGSTPATHH